MEDDSSSKEIHLPEVADIPGERVEIGLEFLDSREVLSEKKLPDDGFIMSVQSLEAFISPAEQGSHDRSEIDTFRK